jgi:hypothetical protein
MVDNRRSHIYEWLGCPYYDAISPKTRVPFASAQTVEQAGYRPARNCPQTRMERHPRDCNLSRWGCGVVKMPNIYMFFDGSSLITQIR